MDGFVRGPLEPLPPSALRPFVARPSFEGLVGGRVASLAGADGALATTAIGVTENPPSDLEGLYAGTVGLADEVVSNEIAAAPGSAAPALINNGDAGDGYRQSALPYLPQSTAPIAIPFEEPPQPPRNVLPPGSGRGPETPQA